MILSALVLAAAGFGQGPAPEAVRIAGRDIPITFPAAPPARDFSALLSWEGYGLAPVGQRAMPQGIDGEIDLSQWQEKYRTAHAKVSANTPTWKIKVFAIQYVDLLEEKPDGALVQHRASFAPAQIPILIGQIATLAGMIEAATEGNLRAEVDFEVDSEPFRASFSEDPDQLIQRYLAPRVNRGAFQADDRVYRGPYDSVIVLSPTPRLVAEPEEMHIGAAVSSQGIAGEVGNRTDFELIEIWRSDFARAASSLGFKLPGSGLPALSAPQYRQLVQNGTPSAEEYLANYSQSSEAGPLPKAPLVRSPESPLCKLEVVQDRDKGPVITYSESGNIRGDGVSLPIRADGARLFQEGQRFLSFDLKTSSPDPISITDGYGHEVVLSTRRYLPDSRLASFYQIVVSPDDRWHSVTIDLEKAGLIRAKELAIGPHSDSVDAERIQLGPIQYSFADFRVAASGQEASSAPALRPNLSSEEPAEIVLALAALKPGASGADLNKAVKLFKHSAEEVRLNAVNVFTRVKFKGAEQPLIEMVANLTPRVQEKSLWALAKQDSPKAWEAINQALVIGPYDFDRETAARIYASTGHPVKLADLSLTLSLHSRNAKIASISAISKRKEPEAQSVLLAFLNQEDPEVRLAVVDAVDTMNETVCGQVLWAAVNDPSDEVPLRSYERLLTSTTPKFKSEAMKGINDESVFVRRELITYMGSQTDENLRGPLMAALRDQDATVRAAALRAIKRLPEAVTVDEVRSALTDGHPLVQLALVELVVTRGLDLPEDLRKALMVSEVVEVAEVAKSAFGGQ